MIEAFDRLARIGVIIRPLEEIETPMTAYVTSPQRYFLSPLNDTKLEYIFPKKTLRHPLLLEMRIADDGSAFIQFEDDAVQGALYRLFTSRAHLLQVVERLSERQEIMRSDLGKITSEEYKRRVIEIHGQEWFDENSLI